MTGNSMREGAGNTEPLVSIVIPVYNGAAYIRDSIQSVLEQNYPRIELLVFDDGSTDNSREILQGYGDRFYWESHANLGQAGTLNKGWEMAKGDILSYLSVDDLLESDAVALSVETLNNRPDMVLSYCDYHLIDARGAILRRIEAPEFDYLDMVRRINCQPGPGVFFRRMAFEHAGGWDSSLRQIPDYEYWLRLGLQGEFIRIPKPLARFRVHEQSLSYAEPCFENAEECVRVMQKFFTTADLPAEVRAAEMRAMSSAHLISARFHLRAGRYRDVFSHLSSAWTAHKLSLLSARAWQLLANGLIYRIRRLVGSQVRRA